MSAHLEQNFGQSANELGAGAILPVNTALAFPTLGGTTTDLSLIVTQKFGDAVSISLGKFNMLDVAARTPLMGGGGETTFWNIGLAAPVSGVTPPYILGGIATVNTAPATFTLMVYDPRNAQDPDVIAHPFSQGTTTSLSAKIPVTLFGLTGYQTLRGVYSTAEGFNFDDAPQLILPPGTSDEADEARLLFRFLRRAAVPVAGPGQSRARVGVLRPGLRLRRQPQSDREHDHRGRGRLDAHVGRTIAGAWRGAITCSAASSRTASALLAAD